jgi:V/A-type H+-transporting ATPase subunit I
MLNPEPMAQVSAIVLAREERAVLRRLGELGAVQLIRTPTDPETTPLKTVDHSEALARCDRFLERVETLAQRLELPSSDQSLAGSPALNWDKADEDLRRLETRVGELLGRRQTLLEQRDESAAIGRQVSSYREVDAPLNLLGDLPFVHFVTGTLPASRLAELRAQVGPEVALAPLSREGNRERLILGVSRQGRRNLDNALERVGFLRESLPGAKGFTPGGLFERSQSEQNRIAEELERLEASLRTFTEEAAGELAGLECLAGVERCLLEAEQGLGRTAASVVITGWIPSDDLPAVRSALDEVTGGRRVLTVTDPDDLAEEEVPVRLRLPRLLRPFALLVSGYGLPRYREVAPTVFVAISYLAMFAMMFGDAGHGAVLAVIGLIAWLGAETANAVKVGLLLVWVGAASMVSGVVYGSYFGIARFKHYALWHDPLEGDPMLLIQAAVGIGVVMVSLGLVLNLVNRFRRRDFTGAWLDKYGVAGLWFYWGMLVLITQYAELESHGLANVGLILFGGLPLLGWMLREPLELALGRRRGRPTPPGGLVATAVESVVGAFEGVLSYLANTISFVRLAAYAMSHAALLMAAFTVAAEVEGVPGVGPVLALLVIVGGNLVAIVLEGIVAAVQALRLEYYEFFGKFYSGNGHPFRPFQLIARNHA